MGNSWLSVTLVLSVSGLALSARMLALMTTPGKSHHILQYSVMQALAKRGHQIVVYGHFLPNSPVENITYHVLNSSFIERTDDWSFQDFKDFCQMSSFFGFAISSLSEVTTLTSEETFRSENIQNLLNSNEKFDVVFVEALISMESMLVFGHKFKAPVVNFQGIGDWITVDWMAGNSLSVAHIPDRISFDFTNQMSFMERVRNTVSTTVTLLYYHLFHLPKHQEIIEKYYKDPTMPHITELVGNIALSLTNAYQTLEYPRPYTPNIVPIGGAHISTHTAPLPQDIKSFMDDAKNGVIFFSLGTIVPIQIFPREYIQAFLNVFKKLPVKVLWKTNLQSLLDVPQNVKLTKWVPQPSVLAHPNCRLFITHGGLMSQHEVLHAGVPVVAIPFFADQIFNVRFYEHLGVGRILDFWTMDEDSIYKAVTTVLNDQRYQENAKKMSRIVRDQPMSRMDSAVYWIEYVLRHRDTRHLRPASAKLPWYQLWLLDVAAAVLTFLCLSFLILYKVTNWVLSRCFNRRHSKLFSDKNKK
ncbi:UDP-glycosyltransferase UGT5-like [Homalodisca vitripennis]|uniref:UDP-glycosyltransferase UGT5-like n=1 Tax=Homalodisca vitripennis TaxID=197043 RepID=UPI001EEA4D40|nr:UDP-glycosyltransferase UGT5-like [Homalodisca vitripennis]XP_046660640.1 UDP-glycosyltransferase UGT5-like [Homalodisca vitripennis]KAG8257585.1 UDP-glucuronosyltransferase 1-1 [Homalodisca vitripennis]